MKKITSAIISFICVICIASAVCSPVFAESAAPEIAIALDSSKKTADITIKNVGTDIYSAQITLNITPASMSFTLTPKSSKAYGVVKTDGSQATIYVDSTDLFSGGSDIALASLKSSKEMTIGGIADLTLVDRSMRPLTYDSVTVSVSSNSSNNQSDSSRPSGTIAGSSGGGTSGGSFGGVFGGTASSNTSTGGFTDVPDTHWAKSSIEYVTEKGLFTGTSDTTFEPSTNMTRAMYVVVLSRFGTAIDSKWLLPCDSPKAFDDVPEGTWYSFAVAWAGGTGLVNGVGENIFAPDNAVTREQIAVMTVNFANLCGQTLPETTESSQFADEESISYWAVDAVHAAQRAGIINGRDGNVFDPQATATRAEVAAILHRFAEALK